MSAVLNHGLPWRTLLERSLDGLSPAEEASTSYVPLIPAWNSTNYGETAERCVIHPAECAAEGGKKRQEKRLEEDA
ncbi:hypothetical protein NITLEN_30084 [Nitrospira lenta]|uniref:Uncharacterized protein n=1 Tax=Nitrospira lenta TaxID=1436998 RepID=A0A330LE02_9BACT|nr:hypothetical protein NITLEN_30084 [Nitrospira lenta]